MRVAGLGAPIALPTLFLQPEKGQGPQRLAAFALQNLSKELTKKPGSGQSLAVFGVP